MPACTYLVAPHRLCAGPIAAAHLLSLLMCCSVPGSQAKMASVGLRLLNNVYASFAWLALAKKMNLIRPRTVRCDQERLAAAGPAVEPLQA